MQCPRCGRPHGAADMRCGGCGHWLRGAAGPAYAPAPVAAGQPAPMPGQGRPVGMPGQQQMGVNGPQGPLAAPAEGREVPMSVGQNALVLLVGLIPAIGLFMCLLWGFGRETPPAKRNLARAMLILHGVLLAGLIVWLLVWVLGLVSRL